ncbi:hypothetical protein Tco_1243329 [Tanacetum coccineum]
MDEVNHFRLGWGTTRVIDAEGELKNVQRSDRTRKGNNATGGACAVVYGGAQNKLGNAKCQDQARQDNDVHESDVLSVSHTPRNTVVNNLLNAELATYKEQVELYEIRASFELSRKRTKD